MALFTIPPHLSYENVPGYLMYTYHTKENVLVRIKQLELEELERDDQICSFAAEIANWNSDNFILVSTSVSFTPGGYALGICTFVEKSVFPRPHWDGRLGPR